MIVRVRSAQNILQSDHRGLTQMFGVFFQHTILFQPPGHRLVPLTPESFQDAFGALDLLHD